MGEFPGLAAPGLQRKNLGEFWGGPAGPTITEFEGILPNSGPHRTDNREFSRILGTFPGPAGPAVREFRGIPGRTRGILGSFPAGPTVRELRGILGIPRQQQGNLGEFRAISRPAGPTTGEFRGIFGPGRGNFGTRRADHKGVKVSLGEFSWADLQCTCTPQPVFRGWIEIKEVQCRVDLYR